MTGKTRYSLRIDPKLRERINKAAKAANRSFNGQVIHLLSTHPEMKDSKKKK